MQDEAQAGQSISRARVRYAETDKMGVMHHASWPVFWEIGRTDYLRNRGKSYAAIEEEDGILFPVVDYGVKILASARYDDEIEIRTRLAELGRVKLRFEYEGYCHGVLIARGFSTHGIIDRDWKIRRLPDEVVRMLRAPEKDRV